VPEHGSEDAAGDAPHGEGPEIGPVFSPLRECRFAVVLYGGVSLAIYMNGVVQELYNLVRATAPDANGHRALPTPLTSTQSVYRTLGQLHPSEASEASPNLPEEDAPILRRFVLDLISGSSAGGINGVYLSKALANAQPVEQLKSFWIEQADIGDLVNDKRSVKRVGHGVKVDSPPKSLLNGNRMYVRLLEALDQMDHPNGYGAPGAVTVDTTDDEYPVPGRPRGLVDEIDLFVTATDLTGVLDRFQLANGVAKESNHRRVWHLRHGTNPDGTPRSDFDFEANPFLAFASRATSSFPFAFAPVSLDSVSAMAKRFDGHDDAFPERLLDQVLVDFDGEERARTKGRWFGDGGALDNSPFTMVIDALAARRSEVPVERRLLYVEPDPADPEARPPIVPPDAVGGSLDLAIFLPRTQTITEDLQRVRKRNETASRLLDLIAGIDADAIAAHAKDEPEFLHPRSSYNEWIDAVPQDLVSRSGYRLKWRASIADLAGMIVRGSGVLTPHSDDATAVERRLTGWANHRVAAAPGSPFRAIKEMLLDLDFNYRVRRSTFIKRRADEMYPLDAHAAALAGPASRPIPADDQGDREEFRAALRDVKVAVDDASKLIAALRSGWERIFADCTDVAPLLDALAALYAAPADDAAVKEQLGLALNLSRADLHDEPVHDELRLHLLDALDPSIDREVRAANRNAAGELIAARVVAAAGQLLPAKLRSYLGTSTGQVNVQPVVASAVAPQTPDDVVLGAFYETFAAVNRLAFRAASHRTNAAFTATTVAGSPADDARAILRYYFDRYEAFDQALLPVWSTFDGELAPVQVMRVSPIDASDLVTDPKLRRDKLAGRAMAHFGAFFETAWRRNDILWGRLDAAEILITALVKGPIANELLTDARRRIVKDELGHAPDLADEVVRALLASDVNGGGIADRVDPNQRRALVEEAVADKLGVDEVVTTLSTVPKPAPADQGALLNTGGRSLEVTAKVFRGVADGRKVGPVVSTMSAVGFAMAHLGAGLAPRSIGQLLRSYWTTLVFLAGLLLLAGGFAFDIAGAKNMGWITVIAVVLYLIGSWFAPRVRGKKAWITLAVLLVGVGLVATGFVLGRRWSDDHSSNQVPCSVHVRSATVVCAP
jgi:patatin-related protein